MGWQARWRDLILAGGVALVAGCSSESHDCCDTSADPCCEASCGGTVTAACLAERQCMAQGGTFGGVSYPSPGVMATVCNFALDQDANFPDVTAEDASEDVPTAVDTGPVSFCCNANSDPCCPYMYCGQPRTPECIEEMACMADGGTWNVTEPVPDGGSHCVVASDGAAPADAAGPDATPESGPPDAGSD